MSVLTDGVDETLGFHCPRCARAVALRFYGPCDGCVVELRATVGLAKTDVAVGDYMPKMNVTPNFVATKD